MISYRNEKKEWGSCTFNRRVKAIEITEQQKLYGNSFREIFFYDAADIRIDGLSLYVSAFAQSFRGKKVEIPDGYELIGLAFATDPHGHPFWMNFNIW